jgi:hypothetical protein
VNAHRIRGLVLYAGAAAALAAAGLWWVRSGPGPVVVPPLDQWASVAEEALPEPGGAEAAGTVRLAAGVDQDVQAENLDNGSHRVEMICVGDADSTVRVRLGSFGDSGRGLECGRSRRAVGFDVGAGGDLPLHLSVGPQGPVVFRYTVVRVA